MLTASNVKDTIENKSFVENEKALKHNKYLKENLIAYIGNKRRLIPLIIKAIESTNIDTSNQMDNSNKTFLDLFAGSGVVSRLAKTFGFEVHSNDWEYYSYIMNKAFLSLDEDIIENGFQKLGGIENAIDILNSLDTPSKEGSYISQYYCPSDDNNPDKLNERMFYTSYNGKKIDAIRETIDLWEKETIINKDEMELLLALLIYEASTRSNTSGVFKGFHNGFGGSNGDALGRILKEIKLEKPTLIDGKRCHVYYEDSNLLVDKLKDNYFDIVYLDPPYNQHQYGSNYHLLNTIAKNDKPKVNKDIYIDGKKIDKSAIRKDWVKTKSSFCYKNSAKEDFRKIVEKVNADHILVSYSIDGIIEFDDMLEILSKRGKLSMVSSEYVKFRGGKQSLTNQVNNIEFVLCVNTKERGDEDDVINIKRKLILNLISLSMKKRISKPVAYKYGETFVHLSIKNSKIVNQADIINTISKLSIDKLQSFLSDLNSITNIGKDKEIEILLKEMENIYYKLDYHNGINIFKDIIYLLSKFNNKKAYILSLNIIKSIFCTMSDNINFWATLDIVESKTFKRFESIVLNKLSKYSNFYSWRGFNIEQEKCYNSYINFIEEYKLAKERYKNNGIVLYTYPPAPFPF